MEIAEIRGGTMITGGKVGIYLSQWLFILFCAGAVLSCGRTGEAAVVIESSAHICTNAHISSDRNGNAVAVWEQFDGLETTIWANRYDAVTGWGTAVKVGTGHDPGVGMETGGSALMLWRQDDVGANQYSVWTNYYVPGSGWGTAFMVHSAPGVINDMEGSENRDGSPNVAMAWEQSDNGRSNIWAMRHTPAGWTPSVKIENNDSTDAHDPEVGIDSAANVIVAWEQHDGTWWSIWANRYDAVAGGWGTPVKVASNDAGDARDPEISVNSAGNAIVVWEQWDGTGWSVWVNGYDLSGGWGSAQQIGTNGPGDYRPEPEIQMDDDGNAVAWWQRWDGTKWSPWVNLYATGSGWGTEERITTEGTSGGGGAIMTGNGNVLTVWQQWDGTRWILWSRDYDAGSGWQPPVLVKSSYYGDWASNGSHNDSYTGLFVVGGQFDEFPQGGSDGPDVAVTSNVWLNEYTVGNGWSATMFIDSSSGRVTSDPRVTGDGSGHAVAVWTQMDDEGVSSVWSHTVSSLPDEADPSVIITSPPDDAEVSQILSIRGTASDPAPSSGIVRVELQVVQDVDGTPYYLTSGNGWSTTPQGITASGTGLWSHDTSLVIWTPGQWYTVTARAYDASGRYSDGTSSFYTYYGGQAYSMLSLELSTVTMLQGEALDAAGKLSRLPDTGANLSGLAVSLEITRPDGTKVTPAPAMLTYDSFGHFEFSGLAGFTLKGTYGVKAKFAGTPSLAASSSETKAVLVGASSGYAVIVEGKLPDNEGLASHNKTANRIYRVLRERGFLDENIYYFNFNTSQEWVDAVPTKAGIQSAVETWARQRMNGSPAPFYFISVDHGNSGIFYIDDETITPSDLDGWMDTLESNLNTAARAEKRVVIIGSCYSGSFIPSISKSGRVVITSSAAGEESYKGPREPDDVRSGEFFLEEFFKKLKKGSSFREAFEEATGKTEVFTKKGGSSVNTNAPYFDGAVQHPLLDDNGDGTGTNALSGGQGDGLIAASLYLGTGLSYDTNSALNPADVIGVTETKYLPAGTSSAVMWARDNHGGNVPPVWMEVRPPSMVLTPGTGTVQRDLNLTKYLMTFNPAAGRWERSLDIFTEDGQHEIFYFVRDEETLEVSPMKRSVVYRNRTGNNPPDAFSLVSPQDPGLPYETPEVKTVFILDWEDAADPNGDPVTYTVLISKWKESSGSCDFSAIDYRKEEIQHSILGIGTDAGLKDVTTYCWKVFAVDGYGSIRESSNVWRFMTNNTNPQLPGYVAGYVTDAASGAGIGNASVSGGLTPWVTLSNGYYLVSALPGTVTFVYSAGSNYTTESMEVEVKSGETVQVNASLTPLCTPSMYFRDSDNDSFGNPGASAQACTALSGYVTDSGDCNDSDPFINPSATEICDGRDNDCDGQIDEGLSSTTYFRDSDGDGYGNQYSSVQSCSGQPAGYVSNSADCNDGSSAVKPGAQEVCDGQDNDCDGRVDEGFSNTYFRDADGDGYGNPCSTAESCTGVPAGYVSNSLDCNDSFRSVHPGGIEVCDGQDNDCDGQRDEGLLIAYCRDGDGDGYGNPLIQIMACSAPPGFVMDNNDCDDTDGGINPSEMERPRTGPLCSDGMDNDCDGRTDANDSGCRAGLPWVPILLE